MATAATVALIGAAFLVAAGSADALTQRSKAAAARFKRDHPCPVSGQVQGLCPGHVVVHVVPLCAEGEDAPGNMQWQTAAQASETAAWEQQYCRFRRARLRS